MKLTDVQVDGFGVWSGLTLAHLSPHCTVFFGPNEAGKSTLLQFLRGVLYGFSPERRSRYLPPLRGGQVGGTLSVTLAEEGPLKIHRRESADYPLGIVTVEAADASVQGESHLRRLLHNVEESTYNNVFAVGLRELQELGTLTDTDAARWLYALTIGLDRVSLHDVQQELERSRLRLLAGEERPSQVGELLAQRDRLRRELEALSGLAQRHGQLAGDRAACEQEIARASQEFAAQQAELGTLKAAVAAYDAWQRRAALSAQLDAIARRDPWPSGAVPRMHRASSAIRKSRGRLQRLGLRRKQVGRQLHEISLNELLWRQAARIEALAEHESWIVAAEQQLRAAEAAAKALLEEQQNQSNRAQQAVPQVALRIGQLDDAAWQALRRPAAVLTKSRRRYASVQRKIEAAKAGAQASRQKVEAALAARGERDLTAGIETAGQRVTQLRRRVQLDERIDQLAKTQEDLERHSAGLLQQQILPTGVVVALGGVFVLGVVLFLGGLVLPGAFTGAWGWGMIWLGLLGTGLAVAAKFTLERSAAQQLETCRNQSALAQSQAKEAIAERDALDRALTSRVGSPALRLQTAEQELAKLEELLPLDTQRQAVEQEAAQIQQQAAPIIEHYHRRARQWREALVAAGLPESTTPSQVRELWSFGGQLSTVGRRLSDAQAEVERHRRELAALSGRIEQTFLAAGIEVPPASSLSDQLRYLRRELAEQENRRQQRDTLRRRRQRIARRHAAVKLHLRKWRRRRSRLLSACRVSNGAEFRQRAADFARVASLISQRDTAAMEIASLLAGVTSEATVASLVSEHPHQVLDDRLAAAARQLDDTHRRQQRLFEQRGQLSEQIRLIGGDRRMAVKRFELAQVEQRLTEALDRWRVLTVTARLLEWIKHDYERNRQPETLRQASEYLVRLTDGHYRRVWTPFGENVLLVDDCEGRSLGIDVLSRGTREQLFLSLRLALVALLARRGTELPMILDDVLVNFDSRRAMAAAEVLHDFANQGHQLLVFTCHEHVAQLFKNARLDVRRLPANNQAGQDLPFSIREELPPARSRPRRVKKETPIVEHLTVEGPLMLASVVDTAATSVTETASPPQETNENLRRIDPPQSEVRLAPVRRRRKVVEVSPESNGAAMHGDRIWLLDGNVWAESQNVSADGEDFLEVEESEESRQFKTLKVLDHDGAPFVMEIPPDDDTLA